MKTFCVYMSSKENILILCQLTYKSYLRKQITELFESMKN